MGEAPFVGIDLGTTNSAVATVVDGRPVLISSRHGGRLTPSVIHYAASGERLVGEAARRMGETDPANTAYAIKRLVGRTGSSEVVEQARKRMPYVILGGPNDDVRVRLGGKAFPLPELAAMILTELRLDAEAFFGEPVTDAVITVPANFSDGQRRATSEAAEIAGLSVKRLVNEPTAAALAYGYGRKFKGKLVVFDLGGGTFDVSVLDVAEGVFDVLATGGDTFLGGEDIDLQIAEWLIAQLPPDQQPGPLEGHDVAQRLKLAAEEAKIRLSTETEAPIHVQGIRQTTSGESVNLETTLTRQFLEVLASPYVKRCIDLFEKVLADSGLKKADINSVLLAGGMTRMPLVRRTVTDALGKEPLEGIDPDGVVAAGAAIEAAGLAHRTRAALLLDVVPMSLGIEIAGGYTRRLIPKNSKTPAKATEIFHTTKDGQERARLIVTQGEADRVIENEVLGDLLLEGLPAARRGEVAIEVHYEVSVNGTLEVSAKNLATGEETRASIEAKGLLGDEERKRLAEREKEYVDAERKKLVQERLGRYRQLVTEANRLFPDAYLVAGEFPEAAPAVKRAAEIMSEAAKVSDSGDPEAIAASIQTLSKLVQSLRDIVRLRTPG